MNATLTDVPAALIAMQDQFDDLTTTVRAQQRTIDALVARSRDDGTDIW